MGLTQTEENVYTVTDLERHGITESLFRKGSTNYVVPLSRSYREAYHILASNIVTPHSL